MLSDRIFEAEPLNSNGKPDGRKEEVIHTHFVKIFIKNLKKSFDSPSASDIIDREAGKELI